MGGTSLAVCRSLQCGLALQPAMSGVVPRSRCTMVHPSNRPSWSCTYCPTDSRRMVLQATYHLRTSCSAVIRIIAEVISHDAPCNEHSCLEMGRALRVVSYTPPRLPGTRVGAAGGLPEPPCGRRFKPVLALRPEPERLRQVAVPDTYVISGHSTDGDETGGQNLEQNTSEHTLRRQSESALHGPRAQATFRTRAAPAEESAVHFPVLFEPTFAA